jgi:hypothetical protein
VGLITKYAAAVAAADAKIRQWPLKKPLVYYTVHSSYIFI